MNHSDEELQNRIEKGYVGDSPDEKAYHKVFDLLKQEPYHLPSNFADKVIIRVKAGNHSLLKDYFWFGLGLFSFMVVTIAVMIRSNFFKVDFGSSKFISTNWGLITFGAIFILVIHFIDKQVIKNKLGF